MGMKEASYKEAVSEKIPDYLEISVMGNGELL